MNENQRGRGRSSEDITDKARRLTSHDGFEILAHTDPERVNRVAERMQVAEAKRKLREGLPPDSPKNIFGVRVGLFRRVEKFCFDFHDQHYEVKGKASVKEFSDWIKEYCKSAQLCVTCDRLLLPGLAVGSIDSGLVHLNPHCCADSSAFAGHIDEKGKLKPLDFSKYEI